MINNYKDKLVVFNGDVIGRFREVIINDCEARLYNDQLEKVIQFNAMSENDDSMTFYRKNDNYYSHNGLDAWDIIDQIMKYYGDSINGSEAFYLGNIFKYLFRFKFKDQVQSDLEKAKDYIDRIVDNL